MHERYLGRIEPDMDVCDIDGDKIGTVAHVYRHDLARVGADTSAPSPVRDEVVEVKTGFLGLGKHFFVPTGAIEDVTQSCVFLSKTADEVKHNEDWQQKPSYLDDLS